MHIAILGWGSLLWDERVDFDKVHKAWNFDGPKLPLEFSRVSNTRSRALTLVIDEVHGNPCTVAYARSTRSTVEDAVADLRCREGTTLANIGHLFADGSQKHSRCSENILSAIKTWARSKGVDAVVWTDLNSNFSVESRDRQPFSVASAVAYLQALSPEGKAAAAEYVFRAPEFVKTQLRDALETAPWFRPSSH